MTQRIVVVEDDNRIGSSLERALAGSVFETRWVRSGSEGITLAREWVPHLMRLLSPA